MTWILSLNFLEFMGLLSLCLLSLPLVLLVGWLAWCAVEGRELRKKQLEQERLEAEAVRRWLAVEEQRWSERCAPHIEKVIEESKTWKGAA